MKNMGMKISVTIWAVVCAAILTCAQTPTGRLVGTVQGPDGVIAGAKLVITDNLTHKERVITANGEGSFIVSNLDVGTYTIKVSAAGFNTYVATDLKIDVGKEYTLNPKLTVGNVAAEVTVSAGADVVNASNAELSNTVTPEQIQTLPINGRNPLSLISLQAGVTSSGSINGQRTSSTNFTRDGLNVQDNFIRTGGFVPDLPNIDDVGEFSVVTQNSNASIGSGGSSQVQTITPRGGTDYHGALYEYNQNSAFASNTFFNNTAGIEKPFLNQNQFGGKISGRLPFPHFGQGGPALYRDKAFFFFDYEGLRLPQSQSTTRVILTPAARQGIFTYIDDNGVQRQDNILTIQGLSLNQVIANRILAGMPTVGNTAGVGDDLNTTGFKFNQRADFTRDATATRVDFDLNPRNTFNFVWTRRWENILRPDTDGGGFSAKPYGFQTGKTNLYVLAYTWTVNDRLNNEIRGGYQSSNPFFNTSGLPSDFFIGNPLTDNVENSFISQGRTTKYYDIQDNAEFRVSQHSLRFGYNGQFHRITSFGGATLPTYNLDNTFTDFGFAGKPGELSGLLTDPNQLATANALQSLLAGLVGSGSNTFNVTSKTSGYVAGAPTIQTFNYDDHAFYVTDQWRAKPNLTLNLGMRYEFFTGITDPRGLRLEPVVPKGVDPLTAILNPAGTYDYVGANTGNTGQFFNTDKNNFSPVLGVSYNPRFNHGIMGRMVGDGKTVIRAGYRASYINDEYLRATDNALQNAGLVQMVTIGQLENSTISAPPAIKAPDFQAPPITYARNNTLANNFGTVFGIDPNIQMPLVHEYNFGIQRELGAQTALEIRYVGAKSDQLIRTIDFNQVDIRDNGFAADFIRARQNLILSGNKSGAFNPAIAGSQPLTVFPNLTGGGLLTNNVVIQRLNGGVPADLAILYVQSGLAGTVKFLANPNTGVANLLRSSGIFNYNSLQVELRRRFTKGLFFQANYTFQKILTNVSPANPGLESDSQTRVAAFLDNRTPRLDYGRADFDNTHIFNFNGSYELPFGQGKKFLNSNGALDRLVGGWVIGSVVRINTGFPLTFVDQRGTLNRAGRSGRQAPQTSLTQSQIEDLIGIFKQNGNVYFIDPKIINSQGRGAAGFGQPAFTGQVFFDNGPGQTGNLQRAFVNGPLFTQVDLSALKNIRIKERFRFQLRAEVFNAFNHTNFNARTSSGTIPGSPVVNNIFNVNSATFGQISDTFTIGGLNRVLQLAGRLEF